MKEEKWYNNLFKIESEPDVLHLQNRRLAAYEAFKKNKFKSKQKGNVEKQKV